MTSTELRTHLLTLTAERAAASEIEAVRHAYLLQHAFSTPIVQETPRPAEPAWLTSVW